MGSPLWGLFACIVAGIGKEVYDARHPEKHKAETMDVVFTMAGGYLVYVMVI